ncbi:MAG TPA: DJ-1/PfpI family protein [Ktedonobacterales bacterium]
MATTRDDKQQIAVVTYPGLSPLELIGTVSVLDGLQLKTGFRPVTVGATRDPLDTDTPLRVVPQRTFDDVPQPSALLVPGASGLGAITAMGDQRLVEYVRVAAERAELVTSVGSGALILAAAGLLGGKRATTHWMYRGILENLGASYIPRRWVEDGKLVTAAGTSGGIDMALHLVAQRKGERTARRVQLWIEYDPQPPFGPMDWANAEDDETLASLLARRQVDWERSLAKRPDLLDAVRDAVTEAASPSSISL